MKPTYAVVFEDSRRSRHDRITLYFDIPAARPAGELLAVEIYANPGDGFAYLTDVVGLPASRIEVF